jgi:hypothetical protein
LNSFQVAVTYADRQGNRFPEDTWNEVSVCFEATVEDGGELTNAPLSIELADGYSDSGDAYISGDLNVGLTYTLHVTRIQ